MAIIRSSRDLRVCNQACAVKSMLTKARANRRYPASFISKMAGALGEATETQFRLDDALERGCITAQQHREMDKAWRSIGAAVNKIIDRADDFCRSVR